MAKRPTLEEKLVALNNLRREPDTGLACAELIKALKSKTSLLVARAAAIAGELELEQATEALNDAFERFMVDPTRTDKGCRAKTAIAEALYRAGCRRDEVFARGIHHAQFEPVYGGKVDTAATLRGTCAMGLVQADHPQVMNLLARLLADPEGPARAMAARAIGTTGAVAAGVPLLRFKVLCGDDDQQVLCECFGSLLALNPTESMPFVCGYLRDTNPFVCEAALLALGESRLDSAFDAIVSWWSDRSDPDLRRATYLAIAMLRKERAITHLLSVVATEPRDDAEDAIAALKMHDYDESIARRLAETVRQRRDVDLTGALARTD